MHSIAFHGCSPKETVIIVESLSFQYLSSRMKIKLKNSAHQPLTSGYLVSLDDLVKNFIPSRYDDVRTVFVSKQGAFEDCSARGRRNIYSFVPFKVTHSELLILALSVSFIRGFFLSCQFPGMVH